ncbi:MAG: hydrogenase expression/formation protein HypE [Alphaproteobacteria bacterium]
MNAPDHKLATYATRHRAVDVTHGGGGRAMADLIRDLFTRHLGNELLDQGHDSALLSVPPGRLAMSTDGHVVSPLFFPGGDIGSLAVHGTINDVAMSGARPLFLTAAFILEEGFPLERLEAIVISMANAARKAGVLVVTGDIGDHGIAILSKRENLEFETEIRSDSAALHGLVADMVAAVPGIAVLRDPTRGGLAATLNEIASQSKVGMMLEETAIPLNEQVSAACELLGLDPLYIANEGKLICICEAADAERLLAVMRAHQHGRQASIIGTVTEDSNCLVQMRTRFGGARVVDWLAGEQFPRIC